MSSAPVVTGPTGWYRFADVAPGELEGKRGCVSLGTRRYEQAAWIEQRWPVPDGPAGGTKVELRALKPYRASNGDPRTFGAAIAGFGFVE